MYLRAIMVFRWLFYIILAYFAFRFIFRFLIPLLIAGTRLRNQIKNMQSQADAFHSAEPPGGHTEYPKEKKAEKKGDYIDFEEVK